MFFGDPDLDLDLDPLFGDPKPLDLAEPDLDLDRDGLLDLLPDLEPAGDPVLDLAEPDLDLGLALRQHDS